MGARGQGGGAAIFVWPNGTNANNGHSFDQLHAPAANADVAFFDALISVVEVADSSLRKDRQVKADLYAEAGIAEYWILNVVDLVLEVHRDPVADHCATVTSHTKDSTVSPLAFPDVFVRVADLFI